MSATKIYDVSIIVINYHSFELIRQCLNSIKEKTERLNYEIIVVDNSENSKEFNRLRTLKADDVHLIDAHKNLGFGMANNLGAEKAKGRYLFFLNNDTRLINNAIFELFTFLEKNVQAGICGGSLFSARGKPITSFFKGGYNLKNIKKSNSLAVLIKRHLGCRDDFNYKEKPIKISGYISGADLMIRADLFNELGGFCTQIFMYGEDSLLCYLCQKQAKKEIWQVPQAKIIHLEGQSTKSFSGEKSTLFVEGTYLYFLLAFGENEAQKFLHYFLRFYRSKLLFSFFVPRKHESYRHLYNAFLEKTSSAKDALNSGHRIE
jgi:GT2 family glycosyltransferase